MKSRSRKITALIATFTLALPHAASGSDPLVFEPSSPWVLNYADDSCQLARTFGKGQNQIGLRIEQFQPGDSFDLILTGQFQPLLLRPRGGSMFRPTPSFPEESLPKVNVAFGTLPVQEVEVEQGELDEQGALYISTIRIRPLSDEIKKESARLAKEDLPLPDLPTVPAVDYEAATNLSVITRREAFVLETGSLQPGFSAMKTCLEELTTHWGIDVGAHRTLRSRARPKPQSNSGSFYPRGAVGRINGVVAVRVSVSAEGKPTACHIQASSDPRAFAENTCREIMASQEFEPAIAADGSPIASYYISRWHYRTLQ